MRGRATGRLCVVIRGVVSDAVPCLFNGVICDLPFNVVGLPKKMGGIIAHPSMICQSPPRGVFCGRAHLRNSPPSLLKIGNNYLKQLAFGARANSPAPICRSSNCHDSECSRCVRRTMLFLKVVLVVSKSQYVLEKNRDAPLLSSFVVFRQWDSATDR